MFVALIQKAPYTTLEPAEGLRHLGGLKVLGYKKGSGIFVDDGVFALLSGQSVANGLTSLEIAAAKLIDSGVELYADAGSLSSRGIQKEDLIEGVKVVDDISGPIAQSRAVLVF